LAVLATDRKNFAVLVCAEAAIELPEEAWIIDGLGQI
jgi:hypothetical protein